MPAGRLLLLRQRRHNSNKDKDASPNSPLSPSSPDNKGQRSVIIFFYYNHAKGEWMHFQGVGEATVKLHVFWFPSEKESTLKRKAPLGANSFLLG